MSHVFMGEKFLPSAQEFQPNERRLMQYSGIKAFQIRFRHGAELPP